MFHCHRRVSRDALPHPSSITQHYLAHHLQPQLQRKMIMFKGLGLSLALIIGGMFGVPILLAGTM